MRKIIISISIIAIFLWSCGSSAERNKERFDSVYQEYLNTFPEETLNSLQLLDSMQPITVTTLDGMEIKIGENSEKPTVLVFFATWCPACKIAMPKIDSAFTGYWRDKVNLVAVGREHSEEELRGWDQKNDLGFDLVSDPERSIYRQFADQSIPRFYVIGKNGEIIYQDFGWGNYMNSFMKQAILSRS